MIEITGSKNVVTILDSDRNPWIKIEVSAIKVLLVIESTLSEEDDYLLCQDLLQLGNYTRELLRLHDHKRIMFSPPHQKFENIQTTLGWLELYSQNITKPV
jgi:hypothetical protein